MAHWTEENAEAFAHKMAFDFIAQIEEKLETLPMSQAELARELQVSEGAVSKVLNNPQNLTLKTVAKYSRALGIKAAIVAYDDDDPQNEKGLVGSEIFTTCWEGAGKPRDVFALEVNQFHQSATTEFVRVLWGETTFVGQVGNNSSTVSVLPAHVGSRFYLVGANSQGWPSATDIYTGIPVCEDTGVETHA